MSESRIINHTPEDERQIVEGVASDYLLDQPMLRSMEEADTMRLQLIEIAPDNVADTIVDNLVSSVEKAQEKIYMAKRKEGAQFGTLEEEFLKGIAKNGTLDFLHNFVSRKNGSTAAYIDAAFQRKYKIIETSFRESDRDSQERAIMKISLGRLVMAEDFSRSVIETLESEESKRRTQTAPKIGKLLVESN